MKGYIGLSGDAVWGTGWSRKCIIGSYLNTVIDCRSKANLRILFYICPVVGIGQRDKTEDKPKSVLVGNSHMAFRALNVHFPQQECLNYGAPGEGLMYVESFHEDTSNCQVVIQFGSSDIYQLNEENTDNYVERYMKAVPAVPKVKTCLLCIFPRNGYDSYSTAVNKFTRMLNEKIVAELAGIDIIYLDVFDQLLKSNRLNPELTIDDLHLDGKGYRILSMALKQAFNGQEHL